MECPECGDRTPFPETMSTVHCVSCYSLLTDEDREADDVE